MRRRFTNMSSVKFNIVDYLTIESLEDGLEVYFSNDIEYGIDGEGWRKLTAFKTIKIDTGQTVSFRGNLKPSYTNGIGTFNVTKNFNLKGTAMSMLFGDEGKDNFSLIGYVRVFYTLFKNCSTLKSIASNFLPATTLAEHCYESMFNGCSSLITAPELPATTLAYYCYNSMFFGCTGLTTAPELPATTLADSCYGSMFFGCTGLTTAPKLPATTLGSYCYYCMFQGCTRLTTAPELPATTLASDCYASMFNGCTSLTTAPVLPATTLSDWCYNNMFNGCSKLNYIKMLATDIPASYCLNNWVRSVSSSGTFVKNPAMTSLPTGAHGIPSGWTVVNDGEESGGGLITFTINDTEYQAEEGMTWEEFVASEYNTDNEIGDKSFRDVGTIQYGIMFYEDTPDGMDYYTEYIDVFKNYIAAGNDVFSDEYIREDINYII